MGMAGCSTMTTYPAGNQRELSTAEKSQGRGKLIGSDPDCFASRDSNNRSGTNGAHAQSFGAYKITEPVPNTIPNGA